jgi:ketosteroid isomerase-like protein
MPATHAGPTPLAIADRRPLVFAFAMILAAVSTSVTLPLASGQESDTAISAADVTAIRAAATAYRAALAKEDAAAIKAAWTEDGDTVDGWGNLYDSKDTATLSGTAADATGPRPDVRVGETRLRLITRDVAIEDGTVDVVLPGMKSPIEGSFTAIWARRGAGWKLAGLRESERPVSVDGDMLEDLDWMVGDWTLAIDGADEKKAAPSMEMRRLA